MMQTKEATKATFQKYAAYKDSGVEWLGEIPEGWETSRLRNVFSFSKGLTITKENLQEEGVYCVNYGEIHSKFGFEVNPEIHKLKCVSKDYLISDTNSLLRKGDFVFADTSEDIDGSGNFTYLNSDLRTFAGYHTVIARLKIAVNERFAAYVIASQSFRNQIRRRVKGVKVFSITQSLLKTVGFWFPPKEEQTAIANFLDDKTAKIDRAIAQKEQLIDLLKERKQIVIQDLVTGKKVWNKSKNAWTEPVEVKDSGVEWIGEIPEGWEVRKFKFLCHITTGVRNTEDKIDNGLYPFFVRSQTPERINSYSFDGEAILTAGDGAGVGKVFHYIDGKFDFHQRVYKFSKFQNIIGKLLFYYLRSTFHNVALNGEAKSTVDSLRLPLIQNFSVTIPPVDEQAEIINSIEAQSTKIDQAISLQQNQIEKLKEYKASLIDSAVTGKIKVS